MSLIARFALGLRSSNKKIPRPHVQRDRDGTGVYRTTLPHGRQALQSAAVDAAGTSTTHGLLPTVGRKERRLTVDPTKGRHQAAE